MPLEGLAPDASSRDWIVGRSAYGSKSGGVEGRWVRGRIGQMTLMLLLQEIGSEEEV